MSRLTSALALTSLVLFFAPLGALAQAEPVTLDVTAHGSSTDLTDARALRDTGLGLTAGGLLTTALGALIITRPAGLEDWSGSIVGGLAVGLGGLSVLAGIPTWIVGGVRSDLLSRDEPDRARIAGMYEEAGVAITVIGLLTSLAGGAMLIAAMVMDDQRSQNIAGVGAYGLMPGGALLAHFIGLPLWVEGARF